MQILLPKPPIARFSNPWASRLLALLQHRILHPVCQRSIPCHQPETWSLPHSLAISAFLYQQKGGETCPRQFLERYSLFDTSLPFSFLLATKFIFQPWQALVTLKPSPLSNHFHQPPVNFSYFSCTFFEMEMNTAFQAKAHHPFM